MDFEVEIKRKKKKPLEGGIVGWDSREKEGRLNQLDTQTANSSHPSRVPSLFIFIF